MLELSNNSVPLDKLSLLGCHGGVALLASCTRDTSVESCSFSKFSKNFKDMWMGFSNHHFRSAMPSFNIIVNPYGAAVINKVRISGHFNN